MNCILIRLGEIFLKGRNRGIFEKLLKRNIKFALNGIEYDFFSSQNRYIIENYAKNDENAIIRTLLTVFGIHSVSVAKKISTDTELINTEALALSFGAKTFRVTVNRADKKFGNTSTQIAAKIGAFIISKNQEIKVNLFDYEREIFVDIRENGYTYIFSDSIKGLGGLPVGSSGLGLLLLSGGIDSPVAGFKMLKRGLKINALHFASPPFTSENAKEKVIELADKLKKYNGELRLFVVPFTEIQTAIHKNCKKEYMITLMRRFMMRIAEKVATSVGASSLITGESLGQVASQTVESITVVQNALEIIPVMRPLIGMDKDEITAIAKDIGTYETSILPHLDCCTVFLPKNPVIHPKLNDVLREETKLDVETLVSVAISGIEVVKYHS